MTRPISQYRRLKAQYESNPDLPFTVLAVVLVVASVVALPEDSASYGYRADDGIATAFAVIQASAVAFVRRWPIQTLGFLVAALMLEAALNYNISDMSAIVAMIVIFIVATRSGVRQAVFGITITAVTIIVVIFLDPADDARSTLFVNLVVFAGAWFAGFVVRSRVVKIREAERRTAELSLQRDLAAGEASALERTRIARELHDAVGHTLNLIVVQAGAARRVRSANPDTAYETLQSIENTGRQALSDMDRMLGILRDRPEDPTSPEFGSRPGLARLEDLIGEARGAGLDVTLRIDGNKRSLPASADLTAYRVIQESITNVIKHAPSSDTTVSVDYGSANLKIEVRNGPGRGQVTSSQGGRGLAGMQERVALFDGTMSAGPSNGSGYLVSIVLPIERES